LKESSYKEWYNKQAEELASLLMRALDIACRINRADYLWEGIKKTIDDLGLPNQKCCRCGAEMSYWDWALRQGMCDACIRELEAEDEEEQALYWTGILHAKEVSKDEESD